MKPDITVVQAPAAPPAIGPYSQGIRCGGFIFLAGQIPLIRDTGKLIEGGVEAEAEQVIHNIKALLASQGATLSDVVKATMFLADMNDFATVNAIYAKHFGPVCPARSTIQVARLPKDAKVEIEVIARAS